MPTEQEIQQHYEHAPAPIQKLLSSETLADEVRLIARRNSLDIALTELLMNEISLVLLGFESVSAFSKNVEVVLDITEQRAKAIASQINEKIFSQMDATHTTTFPESTLRPEITQKIQPTTPSRVSPHAPEPLTLSQPAPHEIEELEKDLMPLRVPSQSLPPQPRVMLPETKPEPYMKPTATMSADKTPTMPTQKAPQTPPQSVEKETSQPKKEGSDDMLGALREQNNKTSIKNIIASLEEE
jgi:hypothetical protein